MPLSLPIEPEATKLLHESPLALILGMLLDQQIPMEKAFSSPYVLKQRLGHDLDAREIAAFDPEAFEAIVAKPPALHRFPRANAKRIQELCRLCFAWKAEVRSARIRTCAVRRKQEAAIALRRACCRTRPVVRRRRHSAPGAR